ncbi:MAG: LysM peptidoglycan-binding domain-containing protein [Victivallales bacterium]
MNGKLFVGGVSAALLAGGMMVMTGCASVEDDPMPPGAYVPGEAQAPIVVRGNNDAPVVDPLPEPTPIPAAPVVQPEQPPLPPAVEQPAKKPAPAAPKKVQPPARKDDVTHVIRKGDSFWSIAAQYGTSMDAIAAANADMNPLKLRVGDKVVVPAPGSRKYTKAAKASAAKTAPNARKRTVAKPAKNDGTYVVRKGDSFSRIAARHRVKAADLAAANNMTLDQTLRVGQKLVIPKAGVPVAKRAAKPADTASKKTAVKKDPVPATQEAEAPVPPAGGAAVPAPATQENVPAAPAVPGESAPAVPAPAAEVPASVASPAALNAVAQDTTPVAAPVTGGYTADIDEDTTLEALAQKYGFGVAELKKLNPEIPANGKVRAGSVIKLP